LALFARRVDREAPQLLPLLHERLEPAAWCTLLDATVEWLAPSMEPAARTEPVCASAKK
jgi:hypothetical protein